MPGFRLAKKRIRTPSNMSSGLFATGWVRQRSKLHGQLRYLLLPRMWRERENPWHEHPRAKWRFGE
jgi:hypothetical protein